MQSYILKKLVKTQRQKPLKRKRSKNEKRQITKDPLAPLQQKNQVLQQRTQGRPREGWAWKFSSPPY
uniref:Uncharacterized protein n=1 Tax=Strigamia maritima TaxID=126957 RepID=T1JF02_STRMM